MGLWSPRLFPKSRGRVIKSFGPSLNSVPFGNGLWRLMCWGFGPLLFILWSCTCYIERPLIIVVWIPLFYHLPLSFSLYFPTTSLGSLLYLFRGYSNSLSCLGSSTSNCFLCLTYIFKTSSSLCVRINHMQGRFKIKHQNKHAGWTGQFTDRRYIAIRRTDSAVK